MWVAPGRPSFRPSKHALKYDGVFVETGAVLIRLAGVAPATNLQPLRVVGEPAKEASDLQAFGKA